MTYSLAKAEIPAPALFDALAEAAVPIAADFNAQDVANTCWAFSSLHAFAWPMFIEVSLIPVLRASRAHSSPSITFYGAHTHCLTAATRVHSLPPLVTAQYAR
eukprot:3422969-Prymnesium_polylepis.1